MPYTMYNRRHQTKIYDCENVRTSHKNYTCIYFKNVCRDLMLYELPKMVGFRRGSHIWSLWLKYSLTSHKLCITTIITSFRKLYLLIQK